MKSNEIAPTTFRSDDARACDAIERLRDDLARARELSPSLVASLENEIETRTASLEKARAAAAEYEFERVEHLRATARRQAAVAALNTSTEVDPDAAAAIVQTASVATYLEGAYSRREQSARDAASAAFARASQDVRDRNAAVHLAEVIAGAVVDREQDRIPAETRPGVIAWLRLVAPVEGAAAYTRSHAARKDHPSYPVPPEPAEYEAAIARVFAAVDRAREHAAKLVRELGAVTA